MANILKKHGAALLALTLFGLSAGCSGGGSGSTAAAVTPPVPTAATGLATPGAISVVTAN